MPYAVTVWVNGAPPALSKVNLDHLETQYAQAIADGLHLTVAETQVYNAVAPVAWTDLDLSATIGAVASIVLLKVTETDNAAAPTVTVRKNGDADEFVGQTRGACVTIAGQNSAFHGVVVCATDAAGVIEWHSSAAQTITVDVIAYINI